MATAITAGALAGDYMETFVVLEWRVQVGDSISEGDEILTIETAKAAVDVEAPRSGVLTSILAEAGNEVAVSTVLGLIGDDISDTSLTVSEQDTPVESTAKAQVGSCSAPTDIETSPTIPTPSRDRVVASPIARRMARDAGIDLTSVKPTSGSGRIKKRDIERAAAYVFRQEMQPGTDLRRDEAGPLKVHRSGSATGVPIIMLHGFASDSSSWYPLDRQLGVSHPIYRIDLPNHGASPKRRVDFVNLVREVRAAFDMMDLKQAHVIGHSLGAAAALALTDTCAARIASLTLIAPGGLSPKINGDFITGIARASKPDSLQPWLKVMVHDPSLIDTAFVRAAFSARTEPKLQVAQRDMAETLFPDDTQSFDLVAALERLEVPARIIWGRQDRVLEWHAALQAPGRIGLHLLKNVGHVPQMEAPELTLGIIQSLINSVGSL